MRAKRQLVLYEPLASNSVPIGFAHHHAQAWRPSPNDTATASAARVVDRVSPEVGDRRQRSDGWNQRLESPLRLRLGIDASREPGNDRRLAVASRMPGRHGERLNNAETRASALSRVDRAVETDAVVADFELNPAVAVA